eukprot:TRINITY_DN621_c0_g1_i5.p1 TRINITY_DN621_c0_g1~~TRINITY_DN621_c0_g1_i5.p1  ORF type:complete len:421 (-),score=111.90 TRINITY_DN621_c0_g1_i5:391-1626(-)
MEGKQEVEEIQLVDVNEPSVVLNTQQASRNVNISSIPVFTTNPTLSQAHAQLQNSIADETVDFDSSPPLTPRPLTPAEKRKKRKKLIMNSVSLFLIFATALVAGLQVENVLSGSVLVVLDILFFIALLLDIGFRFYVYRLPKYFWNPTHDFPPQLGNISDLVLLSIAIANLSANQNPGSGNSILVWRIFRFVHLIPGMKEILNGLRNASLQIVTVFFQIFFIIYTTALLSVMFFQDAETDEPTFETLPWALFTLFQIMTLDGWSVIVREVMVKYQLAWLFFMFYVCISSYFFLLILTGVIIDAVKDSAENSIIAQKIRRKKEKFAKKISEISHFGGTISAGTEVIHAAPAQNHPEATNQPAKKRDSVVFTQASNNPAKLNSSKEKFDPNLRKSSGQISNYQNDVMNAELIN